MCVPEFFIYFSFVFMYSHILTSNIYVFPIDVVSVLIFVFILCEKVLENELKSLNVLGDSWTVTNDKKFYLVFNSI